MRHAATRSTGSSTCRVQGLRQVFLSFAAICAAKPLHAEALPILIDGNVGDWSGAVELVDPAGDAGASGIDLREVDIANDDEYLFLRFQVSVDIGIQESNSLVLYLDTDLNAATGKAVGGIGAELEWRFGDRAGTYHPTSTTIGQDDIRLRPLPSVTASEFEIAIGRDVRPNGSQLLFTGASLRVLLRDELGSGDSAPNSGMTLTYTFDGTPVPPPAPLSFPREQPDDVRLMTWNVRDLEGGSGFDPAVTPAADRVISAIDPQILCFQEIYNASAASTQALVESFLPSGPGETWYAAKGNDNIVVSRFPILGSWPIDGNLAVHLDTNAILQRDVLLVCAHLPCCANNAARQDEADNIMAFFRDAKTAGGTVTVPTGTAFFITGDLNLVGDSQQLATLLTGDIVDEATYGPDFAPDWDNSALADVVSRQVAARFAYTWRSDASTFAPGRLDFIIYSDSGLDHGNHYSVYTPEMPAAELAVLGLQAGDVTSVSDHLPHVADFRPAAPVSVAQDRPAGLRLYGSGPERGGASFVLELEKGQQLQLELFDVRGRQVRALTRGAVPFAAGRHVLHWDGRDRLGQPVPAGTYFLRAQASGQAAVACKTTLVR